jgi:hypothetical protein
MLCDMLSGVLQAQQAWFAHTHVLTLSPYTQAPQAARMAWPTLPSYFLPFVVRMTSGAR